MSRRAGRSLRALFACALLCAGAALAQEEIEAPITADVLPKVALPGQQVTLSGSTPKLQEGAKVTVEITLDTTPGQPGGEVDEPITREVVLDKSGGWKVVLADDDTATAGRYRARVVAPDGKGEAKASFDIVDGDAMGELVDQYEAAMHESLQAAEGALITQLNDLTLGLQPGPERDDAVVRVNTIVQRLQAARKLHPKPAPPPPAPSPAPSPGPEPAPAPQEAAEPPEPIDYGPLLRSYRDITEESDRIRNLVENSRAPTDNCLRMDSLIESLNLTSSLTNFVGKGLDVALNLLGDKILPAMMERQMAPRTVAEKDALFARVTRTKVAIAGLKGLKGVIDGIPGLALDYINHRTKLYYDKYCIRYEGAFSGTMTVEYYTNETDKLVYWSYTTRVGGVVSLSEAKPPAATGKTEASATAMRGRFDGWGMGYDMFEDALRLNPKLRGMLVYHQLVAPPKSIRLPPIEMGVVFNALVHPLGFQVPITAERVGDNVVLNVGEAIRDMDPKFNRGLLVQVFAAGPIPAPNYQVFPMEGGQYILSRGLRRDAKLQRTTTKAGRRLAGTFHREESPPGVRVVWDIDVEACSPACSETTLDRMAPFWNQYIARRKAAPK